MNKYIIITLFLLLANVLFAQQREIKGTVTDATDKSGLPGVTVIVKGAAAQGTATDIDGNYKMKVSDNDILVFSFIGMKSQEIAVKGKTVINVALVSDSEQLDDVIVMGYTTRKKGTVSGAVTTIKEGALKVPVVSFDQALQGQVPGMSVMTSSGAPGATSSVRIRGVNSISAGTDPLYIMDGVSITSGDFSAINPNDIESVTVLKDATSTSIYGARAANGVIVITTKRGKVGEKGRVTYSGKFAFSRLALGDWDMMNSTEKLNYEEKIGIREAGNYNREELEKVSTDWRDVLYNDNAPMMSHDLTISGAGDKSNYYISLGYLTQEGTSISSKLERYNLRVNVEARPLNWLKTGVNTTLGYTKQNTPQSGGNSPHNPGFAVYTLNPYYNPYNADGTISDLEFLENYGAVNPLATERGIKQDKNTIKMVASVYLEAKPIPTLTLKSQLGVEGYDYRGTQKVSPKLAVQNGNGSVSETFERNTNLTMTNLVTYINTFDEKHNLTALLGQEAVTTTFGSFGASGQGYTDHRLMLLGSTVAPEVSGGSVSRAHFLSFFARGEYNYDYKYFLDVSLRKDGSSRFGKNNKWAGFWSVGFMWDVKKETFMNNIAPITALQASFNIGTSGNSSIDDYAHLALMAPGPMYNGEGGFGASALGNPALTWEKILSYNIGVNIGLFDRVRVNAEYYKKKTGDMLMSVPVSMISGLSAGWQNIGKMENSGVELDINVDVIRTKEFNWNIATNFAYNKNRVTELYNGKDEYIMANTGMKLTVGSDMGAYYTPRYAGVDPLNGDALWYTKEGNITNTFSDDHSVLLDKSRYAPWTGGFTNTLSYKGVSVQAFFSWMQGRYMTNNTRFFTESNGQFTQMNQSRKMLNAWNENNRYTEVPKYGNFMQFDDRLLEDASFMRLKNLTVAWDLPQGWLANGTKNVLSGVRLYVQGQNLFTWTNYTGLDPEVDTNVQLGNYPNAKTYLFGIDISF